MRPICPLCRQRDVAISDKKNGKYYFRKTCDACRKRRKGSVPHEPLWSRFGYRKKRDCEMCGFTAKHLETQIAVFHIDGNLQNCNHGNLRSVCLNCRAEIFHNKNKWKESGLKPDF